MPVSQYSNIVFTDQAHGGITAKKLNLLTKDLSNAIAAGGGGAGTGDMTKAIYDTNNNGVVDTADAIPWGSVTSKPATFPPDSTAMLKSVYDTNANNVVDTCDALPYNRLTGLPGTATTYLNGAGAFTTPPVNTGPSGPTGPPGPSAVSVDAGNTAILGSDSLIFVPGGVVLDPVVIQSKSSGNPGTIAAFSSMSITFTAPVAAGDVLVITVSYGVQLPASITQTINSVTDSLGNFYTAAQSLVSFNSPGAGIVLGGAVYTAKSTASGTCTVTANLSAAANFLIVTGIEVQNLIGTIDSIVHTSANSPASSSASSGSLTTTTAKDLLVGVFNFADGPVSGQAGWATQTLDYTMLVTTKAATAIGSYTATAVAGGPSGWNAILVALKPTAAAFIPSAHALSHLDNGSDPIPVVTTIRTGLTPKLSGTSTTYLNGTGTYTTPPSGTGDMTKAVYDTNGDGISDHAALADTAPWTGISGKPASFTPSVHAPTHLDNGTDPIPVATISRTGLLPILNGNSGTFLNGAGTFSAPAGSGDMLRSVYDTNANNVVDTCDSLAWGKLTGVPTGNFVDPGTWTALTYSTGWTQNTAANFRVETNGTFKKVHCEGIINYASGAASLAFTLPSGARPAVQRGCMLAGYDSSGDVQSFLATVTTAGVVNIFPMVRQAFSWPSATNGSVYLDGLTFAL